MDHKASSTLNIGYHDIPAHHLGAIVTYLSRENAAAPPRIVREGAKLVHISAPDPHTYLELFKHVGAPWLWQSRLRLPQAELSAWLQNPAVEVYAVHIDTDSQAGLLELDYRADGACEISFFGIAPNHTDSGYGGWLMSEALAMIDARARQKVTVNTCTLDHPKALMFYQKWGFTPLRRAVEILADPRYSGLLPKKTAPEHPLL